MGTGASRLAGRYEEGGASVVRSQPAVPRPAYPPGRNTLRMEPHAQDAERNGDSDLAKFLPSGAGGESQAAEQGKDLLRQRLTA